MSLVLGYPSSSYVSRRRLALDVHNSLIRQRSDLLLLDFIVSEFLLVLFPILALSRRHFEDVNTRSSRFESVVMISLSSSMEENFR